jgi:hypothetical protein
MKARVFIAIFAATLSLTGNLHCKSSTSEVLKAIRALIQNPNSSSARSAGKLVLQFAEATPHHTIHISLGYLPWANSRNLPDGSQLLLAAFVAGNLREQIRKHSSRPEPYAGALVVIEVYQKILRKRPGFKIPKVEKFIAMEKSGLLKAHIESVRP